jgi:hypothetical protein
MAEEKKGKPDGSSEKRKPRRRRRRKFQQFQRFLQAMTFLYSLPDGYTKREDCRILDSSWTSNLIFQYSKMTLGIKNSKFVSRLRRLLPLLKRNERKIHRIHASLFMDGWMDGGPKLNGKINHVSESTSLKISYSNWKIGPEKNLPRFCQVRIQVSRNFLSVF